MMMMMMMMIILMWSLGLSLWWLSWNVTPWSLVDRYRISLERSVNIWNIRRCHIPEDRIILIIITIMPSWRSSMSYWRFWNRHLKLITWIKWISRYLSVMYIRRWFLNKNFSDFFLVVAWCSTCWQLFRQKFWGLSDIEGTVLWVITLNEKECEKNETEQEGKCMEEDAGDNGVEREERKEK
jgi:hypothetical protein